MTTKTLTSKCKLKALGGVILFIQCSMSMSGQVIDITDYGATADNSGDDDRKAIVSAIAACRDLENPVLLFPEGTYHLNSESGSGTYFYINDIDDLTIQGSGSTIEILGSFYNRHVFEYLNCKNLNVKNLNIDYREVPFSQGKIINAGLNYLDVQILEGFNPEGKTIRAYAQYDNVTGQQISSNESFENSSWQWQDRNSNIIRIHNNSRNYTAGMFILLRHALYDGYSFIVAQGCEDVVLENLTIYLAPGYPFHATNGAKNVSFLNCGIKKKTEAYWATSTVDGAHLLDVRGNIIFDNCHFENMCDDAINLHGYFHDIIEKVNSFTLRIKCNNPTWYRAIGYSVGDEVEFYDAVTHQSVATNIISEITYKNGSSMTLVFMDPVPQFQGGLANYKMANISLLGQLTVRNSRFKANRARGILISTSNVVVENCTFERIMMNAILLSVSTYWNESRPAQNVIIRNNIFDDCNFHQSGTHNGVVQFEATFADPGGICKVFKNVTVSGNTFRNSRMPALYARYINGLKITNNIVESFADGGNLIRYGNCMNPVIGNNPGSIMDNMGGNCSPKVPVSGITLNPGRISLAASTRSQLTTTFTPQNATDQTVTWESSDSSVATVDELGYVTAVGSGTATINAISNDGSFNATSAINNHFDTRLKPWFYHAQLGWLYDIGGAFYSRSLGTYLFMDNLWHPWIFNSDGDILYIHDEMPWIFNTSTGSWLNINPDEAVHSQAVGHPQ